MPEYAKALNELRGVLQKWMEETGDNIPAYITKDWYLRVPGYIETEAKDIRGEMPGAASNRKDKFLVYFPAGGSVDIFIEEGSNTVDVHWIGVAPGNTRETIRTEAATSITLNTPDDRGWFAVFVYLPTHH